MRLEVSKVIDGFPRPSMVPPYRNPKSSAFPRAGLFFVPHPATLAPFVHRRLSVAAVQD